MIRSRVSGSVRSQIEDGAGRADLPFRYVGFPRHVLRDLKTWRGSMIHHWWNTPDRWDLRTTEKSSAVRRPGRVRESHSGQDGLKVSKDHIWVRVLLSQQHLLQPAVRRSGGQADQAVRVGSFGLSRWEGSRLHPGSCSKGIVMLTTPPSVVLHTLWCFRHAQRDQTVSVRPIRHACLHLN